MRTAASLGTEFENKVAEEMRRLGFEVWQDCYVPTEEGYTQVDIIALRHGQLWAVECKNWGGELDAFEWKLYSHGTVKKVNDFTKQNYWHCYNINWQVGLSVLSCVVLNDGLRLKDNYLPTRVVHLRDLEKLVGSITYVSDFDLRKLMLARATFTQWTATSDEVKKQHRVRLQDKYAPPEALPLP